ncbi:phosphatidylinositol glycan class B [Pedobacter sp. UYEF25]
MKSIFQSVYSKYFVLSLVISIITAWFSKGFHHPDEQFQILEFANYKLGNSPLSDLPWEFSAKIRSGLQPYIAFGFIKVFNYLGVENPFILAFFLRLITAVCSWVVVSKLILLLLPNFSTENGKKIFIFLSLFLWFVPYINVRFSSENAAAISYLFATYLLLKPYKNPSKENVAFFVIGLLLSFSFFFRFQMAFAIIGLGLWLIFIHKIAWRKWFTLIFSGLVGIVICIFLDKWLYGTWQLTPYNYYVENVIKGVAANFGVSPWWYYFNLFFLKAIPPLSLAILYFFAVGIYKKPLHIFSFVAICFIVGHSIIGHKEMRFLFPIWFLLTYLAAIGCDYYFKNYSVNTLVKYGLVFLAVINGLLLLFRTFFPAQEALDCYSYVYKHFRNKPVTIYCVNESLYSLAGIKTSFYKQKNVTEIVFDNEANLSSELERNHFDSVYVFKKKAELGAELNKYKSERIYSVYPAWVLKFNISNWQDRANIWSIYLIHNKKKNLIN